MHPIIRHLFLRESTEGQWESYLTFGNLHHYYMKLVRILSQTVTKRKKALPPLKAGGLRYVIMQFAVQDQQLGPDPE